MLPELLAVLARYFSTQQLPFYVVGATARDMVLGMIHDRPTGRKTNDLDIAIMVEDWTVFEKVDADLTGFPAFTKSHLQKQRWRYKGQYELDIVPFGAIAQADRHIYWPPNATPAMSVAGFTAMAAQCLDVWLDNTYLIHVASLPGLFVLKFAAWHDRHHEHSKDAEDMGRLLDEYLDINVTRVITEHRDIYDRAGFTTFTSGAILMGRDVRILLADDPALRQEMTERLARQIDRGESSLLIQQIMETHRLLPYEEVLAALVLLQNELTRE